MAVLLVVAVFCCVHLWSLCRGRSTLDQARPLRPADVRFRELHVVFWTAVLFWIANCGLVVLVEPAQFRYMVIGNLLLPAVLACFVARYAEVVLPAWILRLSGG